VQELKRAKRKFAADEPPAGGVFDVPEQPAAAINPAKEKRRAKQAKEKLRSDTSDDDMREQPALSSAAEAPAGSPAEEREAATEAALPAGPDFQRWYLSTMANCFADEIEALHGADGAVPGRVLARALGAGVSLFSPLERRLAMAATAAGQPSPG
jgi:hypothetical protein